MIKTYSFYTSGVIPGIPGEWHAGQLVDVDEATMTVVGTRLMPAPGGPPDENATSPLPDLEQPPDSSPKVEPRKGK